MLPDELGTYLVGAGLGLVLDANLFVIPFPDSAPDQAVCLTEYGAEASEGTFGASLSPAAIEHPAVKVIVRDGREAGGTARTTADAIHKKLRRLTNTTLSGVLYFSIDAGPVQWLGYDEMGRPRYHFDVKVSKAES